MVFKKMLQKLGVGGPSVETVLTRPDTQPGGTLTGQVHISGGDHAVDIDYVALGLVTRVEVESDDAEFDSTVEFQRLAVTGAFGLAAGEKHTVPFEFPVPWETPITAVYGQHLHGMTMGLRTELEVARAMDKTDLDPVTVHPIPTQQGILDAFNQLGFRFKGADLERGRLHGVSQQLPFYQEVEFYAPPQYRGVNEVELTFVTNAQAVEVILEFDKRGGLLSAGHDAYGRFSVAHAEAGRTDWTGLVDSWLRQAGQRRGFF